MTTMRIPDRHRTTMWQTSQLFQLVPQQSIQTHTITTSNQHLESIRMQSNSERCCHYIQSVIHLACSTLKIPYPDCRIGPHARNKWPMGAAVDRQHRTTMLSEVKKGQYTLRTT